MAMETLCRACQAKIIFIKTTAGKTMPCDANSVYFVPDPVAKDVFVCPDGSVKRGRPTTEDASPLTGEPEIGYTSHFATCANPDFFRKSRKSDRKKG